MINKTGLIILDGVGERKEKEFNAVKLAYMPTYTHLKVSCPFTTINASGEWVGLGNGDMGNSEVGHNTIGCGYAYPQGANMVSIALKNKTAFNSKCFLDLVDNVKQFNSTFHLVGLLSDGRVHSDIEHLKLLLSELSKLNVKKVRLHTLLDGRDVAPQSAIKYIKEIEDYILSINENDYLIASGGGRMKIVMDRYDSNFKMVKDGFDTVALGIGKQFTNATSAVEYFRKNNTEIVDQDIPQFVITDKNGNAIGKMQDNDSMLMFNYRADRAVEFSSIFEKGFNKFNVELTNIHYAGLVRYDEDNKIPKNFMISTPEIDYTLSNYLLEKGLNLYAVSETQKYGHITKYFNGNHSKKFDEKKEVYKEVPSSTLPFVKDPKMKCKEITDEFINAFESNKFNFLRLNFPNGDMVGHTGNLDATIKSLEAVDIQLARIVEYAEKNNVNLIIIADHGNSEDMGKMVNGKFQAKTSHTTNKVPFIVISNDNYVLKDGEFGLSNVANSLCRLLGLEENKKFDESIII